VCAPVFLVTPGTPSSGYPLFRLIPGTRYYGLLREPGIPLTLGVWRSRDPGVSDDSGNQEFWATSATMISERLREHGLPFDSGTQNSR